MEGLVDEKVLELRMYFFVPYNISPIQHGIQAGHSALRYALKYGRHNPEHIVWDFIEKFQTWIILNGGTTNDERDFEMIPTGSLNQIGDQLQDNDVEFSFFIESDLNHALTALCLICDERVFNRKDYPDLIDYLLSKIPVEDDDNYQKVIMNGKNKEGLILEFPELYKEWIRLLGGVKNAFLRELIKDKKLA